MAKKKISFMEALLGSFKTSDSKKNNESSKTNASKDDKFYDEEGKFDEFTEVKKSKKKKLKGKNSKNEEFVLNDNASYEQNVVETNLNDTYIEVEEPKNKKKTHKKSDSDFEQENNDFNVEEANEFTGVSDFGQELEAIETDTLLGKIKKNLKFVILIGGLIVLLIVVLIVQSCTIKPGSITGVNVNIPSIIYLDEQTKITATAMGKRNLSQTKYHFEVTNEGIVELEAKGELTGKHVTNKLIPLTTGKFAVVVKTQLGTRKLQDVTKQVVICKRLTKESLATEDGIIVEIGTDSKINLDVGTEDACFNSLKFKIDDTEIVSIDEDGSFSGKKAGKTKITITDGKSTITSEINVKEAVDLTRVTSLKLNKDSTTIKIGETEQLTATILPETATNKSLIWKSNNESVVTVSNKGLIKGIGQGIALVIVETEDKKQQALIIINIESKNTSTGDTTPKDKTAPQLTKVSIISTNSVTTEAIVGDRVTLEVQANEKLGIKPSMYIGGEAVEVSCDNSMIKCVGSIKVNETTTKGKLSIKVVGYKDNSANTGAEVTTTTDGSSVTIYSVWSDWTDTPCDTTNTLTCKTKKVYQTRIVSWVDGGPSACPTGGGLCCTPTADTKCVNDQTICIIQDSQTGYASVFFPGSCGAYASRCSRAKLCQTTDTYHTYYKEWTKWTDIETSCDTNNYDTCRIVTKYSNR